MQLFENVSLRDYSTMRLGGPARYFTMVDVPAQMAEAVQWAGSKQLPVLVLGGGSNVIIRDEGFDGLVIIDRIMGFEVIFEDDQSTTIKIGGGENWDSVVARTVDMGLSGIEFLSLIPGTTGATPVQNVGAYGAEIADVLTELEAYDMQTHTSVHLSREDCGFRYRNSIFKSFENRRYIITNITLKLSKSPPKPPFYANLQNYLDEQNIHEYTPKNIREAVIAIRTSKLPDPDTLPNTGSFFKNPIVERSDLETIQKDFPDVPFYETSDNKIKIPAGWLIDTAGLKGYTSHGMKIYEKNALVFVNEGAQTYADLKAFQDEVRQKVYEKFKIQLEQEPELI